MNQNSHLSQTNESITFQKKQFFGKPSSNNPKAKKRASRFIRIFKYSAAAIVGTGILGFIILFGWYLAIAKTLPSVDDLQSRASQFETTTILDRNGDLLFEVIDPNAGRREYIPLDEISPFIIAATIATEDKEFYAHPGFDLIAIARATIQNIQGSGTRSGASTITQQLARNLLLSPEERRTRSIQRKVKEIFLAAEITRRYSKNQILELYLNENYYSNFAYGIEAAAKTYFGIPAKYVDFAQAAFLAGLPQAPGIYDVFTNREKTLDRQKTVLILSYLLSQQDRCIFTGTSHDRVCIDETMVNQAITEISEYEFNETGFRIRYPHWVNYIRNILEKEYGAQELYRAGFTVTTSIDPTLQDAAQTIITEQIAEMGAQNAHNGALITIRPQTGEILTMVGSPDFNDKNHGGQINMALAPRQPGSAIKPLIYAAAFEKGWTPATLIWDVPTVFSSTGRAEDLAYSPPYLPENYDQKYHGPVLVRDALANSYNIPAVKALEFVGIYEHPETQQSSGFIDFARRFHIDSLDKPDYGLSIALGGGEATLLEMTSAFSALANNGLYTTLTPILKIETRTGELIFENSNIDQKQLLAEEHAYQITSILSDNNARAPMFGANSIVNLPFPTAVKTGTTNDFRDNWTIGYSTNLCVGVWIGNADYQPMINTTGLSGAAPAWAKMMQQAAEFYPPSEFFRPSGIIETTVCTVSGTVPSANCPSYRNEIFAYYQPPLPESADFWKKSLINTWNGRMANEYCPEFNMEVSTINIHDEDARQWIFNTGEGLEWARKISLFPEDQPLFFTPDQACDEEHPSPMIQFVNPSDGSVINSDITEIMATIYARDGILRYSLEFGRGEQPNEWFVITTGQNKSNPAPDKIGIWQTSGMENGIYTLKLFVQSAMGTTVERQIHVQLQREEPILVPFDTQEETVPPFFIP